MSVINSGLKRKNYSDHSSYSFSGIGPKEHALKNMKEYKCNLGHGLILQSTNQSNGNLSLSFSHMAFHDKCTSMYIVLLSNENIK